MGEEGKYKKEKIKSASDLEALIFLYDEAIELLSGTQHVFNEARKGDSDAKNIYEKNIRQISKILNGLRSILRPDVDRDLANRLYHIYDYLLRRLMVAEQLPIQGLKIIKESIEILTGLRESWVKVQINGDSTSAFKKFLTTQESSFLNIKI